MFKDSLRELFEGRTGESFSVSFAELEDLVDQRSLARRMRHEPFWAADKPWAVWVRHGFVAEPDIEAREVLFRFTGEIHERVMPEATAAPSPSSTRPPVVAQHVAGTYRGWVDGDWDAYWRWNHAIREHFYSGDWAGRPVYLDVEDDVLEALAEAIGEEGDPRQALAEAVSSTLAFPPDGQNVFRAHLTNLERFRRGRPARGLEPADDPDPPYLALLAAFVRAAEEMASSGDFAANNYYGRLGSLLGADTDAAQVKGRLISHFQQRSLAFWDSLNGWLERQGGAVGLPTAQSWGWWRYVGVPMSQALVKEHDRKALIRFFYSRRLDPQTQLAPVDMERALVDWLPGSDVGWFLKQIWAGGALQRRRIAEVACNELANWDGEPPANGYKEVGSEGLLLLWAQVRKGPPPRLDLGLLARSLGGVPPGRYQPGGDIAPQVRNALGDPPAVEVEPAVTGLGSPAIEVGEWSFPDLLLTPIRVSRGGFELERMPRPVVALARDDLIGAYLEVDRLELAVEAVLLSHRNLADELEAILSDHARPGFERLSPPQLPGLPDEWVAFVKVELVASAASDRPEFGLLTGYSSTALRLVGGLRLPGLAAWHVDRLPEAVAAVEDGSPARVLLARTQALDPTFEHDDGVDLGEIQASGAIDLGGLDLVDGDYALTLEVASGKAREVLASASLRVRSGNWPRVLADEPSAYALVDGFLDPVTASDTGDDDWLRGSVGPGPQGGIARHEVPEAGVVPGGLIDDDLGPRRTKLRGPVATCALDGAHYWLLPMVGPAGAPAWMEGTCRKCGLVKGFPKRPGRKKASSPTSGTPGATAAIPGVGMEPIAEEGGIDHDLLLDALTYAVAGAWMPLAALAGRLSDESWVASEVAQTLLALGHLDLQLNARGLRPERWSISPAALALLEDGTALLAGERSDRLLEAVGTACDSVGAGMSIDDQLDGPRRVIVDVDSDREALEEIARVASEGDGADVAVAVRPGLAIASRLPPMRDVATRLLDEDVPSAAIVKRFDPAIGRWVDHKGILAAGAYRFLTRPVRYGFVAPGQEPGRMLSVDYRWAKWLGVAMLGWEFLTYDRATRSLRVPLGAQLPGLYERAVVLSSGWAPRRMAHSTVEYREVPEDVIGLVWAAVRGSAAREGETT